MTTTDEHDSVLDTGLLTSNFLHLLSISRSNVDHLCPAYGTEYCSKNCPHSQNIPETCPMRDDEFLSTIVPKLEGISGRGKISIYCCICEEICPCNRSLNFEEVSMDVDRYAQTVPA